MRELTRERKVVQKLYRICGEDEFTVEQAICMLKDEGFRNIPTSVGLGQMLRISPHFDKVKVVYQKDVCRKYRIAVWKRKENETQITPPGTM